MTTSTTSTTTHFRSLATPHGANERFAREWRAGRWPAGLPLPRVRAVRCLRLHPGSRCTFRYTVEGWPEAEYIAKAYAHLPLPATQTLAALRSAGFGAPGRYRVPEVIAALPAPRLVVMRVAAGKSSAELLQGGDLEAATRVGEWLGAFHATPVALPAAYMLRDPLALAARWSRWIAHYLPEQADRADSLHSSLIAACPPWPTEMRLIHGDFGVAHVFVAAEATTVIDWDTCRAGDPAEDAGRFIASLWHLEARGRITHDDATVAERHFRDAYAVAQPRIAPRLPFYAALACLRRAAHHVRHGNPQLRRIVALLTAGLAELDGARQG